MDPNFSVLLDYETEDKCAEKQTTKNKKVNTKVIIATVIAAVAGAAIIAVVAIVVVPRAILWWKMRKASRDIDLDDSIMSSGYNSSPAPVIERAPDMEIQTAAGRFVVKM